MNPDDALQAGAKTSDTMETLTRQPTSPATYADLEAVPPHLVAEILYGTLVTHPRPAPRHAFTVAAVTEEVVGPFQKAKWGPGGWVFLSEPELHLADHVVVPDLAGWRQARMPALPESAYLSLAPDWVCEVLSPSTERHDRNEKRQIYAEAGVTHLWLLDPTLRMLEVFELTGGKWLLLDVRAGSDAVRAPPFDAVSFNLASLWPRDEAGDQVQ